jgi:hypothetical protein
MERGSEQGGRCWQWFILRPLGVIMSLEGGEELSVSKVPPISKELWQGNQTEVELSLPL